MARFAKWTSPAALPIGWLVLALALAPAGCNRSDTPVPVAKPSSSPADPSGDRSAVVQAARVETQLHQSFAEATLADMPDQYLPDMTLSGKSVGKLYEQVVRRWDHVAFLTAKGEKVGYTVSLDTEMGSIDIELYPELAPNHVRNFLVLVQAGYYDGLVFERTINDQAENDPSTKVQLIEAGCPVGLGNPGYGSIGYWLQPEFSSQVKHEEGTVGACRGEDPYTGACRFYITLGKAPVMDGHHTIFGKVTRGLDVVRRISTQPVLNTPDFPLGDRPEKPVVIRKASVKVKPAAAVVAQGGKNP